jgi:hypothetical protein
VSGAQQVGWSLEGQKNRVKFDITLSRIVEVRGHFSYADILPLLSTGCCDNTLSGVAVS